MHETQGDDSIVCQLSITNKKKKINGRATCHTNCIDPSKEEWHPLCWRQHSEFVPICSTTKNDLERKMFVHPGVPENVANPVHTSGSVW